MGEVRIVIMAGGRGSRFGGPHKPVARVCGRPMILRVASAAAPLGEVVIAVSPGAPWLGEICRLYRCVETSGRGYVEDLAEVLERFPAPVLILPADMPHITTETLAGFVRRALSTQAQVVTLRRCEGRACEPTGISLFRGPGGSWANIDLPQADELLDVDAAEDLERAEKLCAES